MPGKILLVCALYIEAKPFIAHLKLKEKTAPSGFQIFENEQCELIITGTGKVASACGTTFLLSRNVAMQRSLKVCANIGICGAKNEELGSLFLIDQIIDKSNKRSFYSDILEKTKLQRKSLATVDIPLTTDYSSLTTLVDMEASGFFQAAHNFLSPDKIQILKIISDNADTDRLDLKRVETYITQNIPDILEYLESFSLEETPSFSAEEEKIMAEILNSTHFTTSQQIQLRSTLWSLKTQGENIISLLKKLLSEKSTASPLLKQLTNTLQNY